MRKVLVLALSALCLTVFAAPAQADTLGSFVSSRLSDGKHRVFFTVTAGKGSKTCVVKLRGKIDSVDLGTDKVGEGSIVYFFAKSARIAYEQAQSAPSPTPRIVCSH